MKGDTWYAQRKSAEQLLVKLAALKHDDLKTLQNAELKRVIELLNEAIALAVVERRERKGR